MLKVYISHNLIFLYVSFLDVNAAIVSNVHIPCMVKKYVCFGIYW